MPHPGDRNKRVRIEKQNRTLDTLKTLDQQVTIRRAGSVSYRGFQDIGPRLEAAIKKEDFRPTPDATDAGVRSYTPDEVAFLKKNATHEALQETLGVNLPESVTTEQLLQMPEVLRRIKPASVPRVEQIKREEGLTGQRESLAARGLRAIGLERAADFVSRAPQANVGSEITEVGAGVLRAMDSSRRRDPDYEPEDELDEIGEALDVLFLNTMDVTAQTTGEAIRGAWLNATFRGDQAEKPTLLKYGLSPEALEQGSEEAVRKFDDRPLWEQVALGFLDPTIIAGGGRLAVRGTKALAKGGLKRGTLVSSTDDLGRTVLRTVAQEEAAVADAVKRASRESRVAQPLSSNADVLGRVNPRSTASGLGYGRIRRFFDPSSEMARMPRGSDERIIAETDHLYKNLTEEGQARVTEVMARIVTKGDPNDLFGISTKIGDEPRATKITHFSDGTPLKGKPQYAGNVFEHPDAFQLTREQREWIDFTHEILDDVLRVAKAEGLDIEELGSRDDLFYFFPRRVYDPKLGKNTLQVVGAGSRAGTGVQAHRLLSEMSDVVLAKGAAYRGPLDALESYFTSMYTAMARKRAALHAKPLTVQKRVPEFIQRRAANARARVARQATTIDNIKKMKRNFVPSGATRAAMKRHFPELADQIDAVTRLRPTEIDRLINEVSAASFAKARVTPKRFRDALLHEQIRSAVPRAMRASTPDVGPSVNLSHLHDELEQIAASSSDKIQNLRRAWNDLGGEQRLQEYGAAAARDKGYVQAVQDFLRKHFPDGKLRVYHGRGVRGVDPATKRFTNISLEPRVSDTFARANEGTLRAWEVDISDVVGFGTSFENELIVRSKGLGKPLAGVRQSFLRPGQAAKRGQRLRADFKDVDAIHATVRALSLDAGEAEPLVKEMFRAREKLLRETRNDALDELAARMEAYAMIAKEHATEAVREVSRRKAANRTPSVTEGRVPSLDPTMILKDAELAADLERRIADASGAWRIPSNLNGAIRNLRTVVDVGAPFIQGLPLLFNDPEAWGRATKLHFQALANPRVRQRFIAENAADLNEYLAHGGHIGSSEYTDAILNGGWVARLPNVIQDSTLPLGITRRPASGVARTLYWTSERFSNTFETYLDVARIETWKGLRPSARTQSELDELADFVNKLTGTSSTKALGVPLSQRQFESALPFFAPRYFRSTAALVMDTMSGRMRGQHARRALSHLFVGLTATHVAAAHALGQEPNLNPLEGDRFLRVQFGNQYVGFGGKALSFFKLGARIVEQSYEKPDGFLDWRIWNAEAYRENPLLGWLRNQSAPTTGSVISVVTQSDPIGQRMPSLTEDPGAFGAEMVEQFGPFWISAALEGFLADADASDAGVAAIGDFAGLSGLPVPPYRQLEALRDKYAREDFGASWEDIQKRDFRGAAEGRELMANHEDLRELQARVDRENALRAVGAEGARVKQDRLDSEREWLRSLNIAASEYMEVIHGANAPRKLREEYRKAGAVRRAANARLEREHPEVFERMRDAQEEFAEDHPEIAARQAFFDALSSPISVGGVLDDQTNNIDYAELDKLKTRIDEDFGDGMYAKLDAEMRAGQFAIYDVDGNPADVAPIIQDYIASFTILRPFWEAYKDALPEEQWDDWRVIEAMPPITQDQALKQSHNLAMSRAVKARQRDLRRSDRDIDLALLLFYGYPPRHRANQRYIRELVESERELVR